MNLFRSVGILGSLVLAVLAGCSNAAREASRNDAPVAQVTLVTANSPAHVGTVLQARYQYVDAEGDAESGTVKVWLRDGEPIQGADQDNYTATRADSGAKLQFRVTPAAASGKSPGAAVLSSEITIENSLPHITGLVIGKNHSGPADIDTTLTASYSFHDLDGDAEAPPLYQWLRNGTDMIGDQPDKTYTLTNSDLGKTISVKVTPSALFGASPGLPRVSIGVKVASPTAALTVSAGLKQLHFSWAPVRGMSTYHVFYNPDGVSGFVPLAADSSNLTVTTYDWDIAVHRINLPKAQFMLKACDAETNNGCVESPRISALNVMLETIGYFKASNSQASDVFGTSVALSADGLTLAVGAFEDSAKTGVIVGAPGEADAPNSGLGDTSGAVYVFTRRSGAWSQQAYVKASNPGLNDWFGGAVALSADGNTLAVGAPNEDSAKTGVIPGAPAEADTPSSALGANSGAAYIYVRSSAGTWTQQAYVKATNTGAGDYFGAVALSDDGNTLAVGAYQEDSAGVNGNPVDDCATTTPPVTNCALDSGAVYVYTRSAATWSPQAYVKASHPGAGDSFSRPRLSADGLTLAASAHLEDSAATGIGGDPVDDCTAPSPVNCAPDSGAVYVYTRSSTTSAWDPPIYVKASNTGAKDTFGRSLALSSDGNTFAVGALQEDGEKVGVTPDAPNETDAPNGLTSADSGAVYVYARSVGPPDTWVQQAYVKASNPGAGDGFGVVALSANGNTLAVGALYEDSAATGIGGDPLDDCAATSPTNCALDSGAVYVYTRSSATWSPPVYVKAPNTGAGDSFALVKLSGDGNTLVVGAHLEDSAATGVNNTAPGQGDNSADAAGAVYLY